MPHAVWTPLAEAELEDIVFYIAVQDGRPATAQQIAGEIGDRADDYANSLNLGGRHPDFPVGWLYFLHKRWFALFQAHHEGIEILRIIDASRDLKHLSSWLPILLQLGIVGSLATENTESSNTAFLKLFEVLECSDFKYYSECRVVRVITHGNP